MRERSHSKDDFTFFLILAKSTACCCLLPQNWDWSNHLCSQPTDKADWQAQLIDYNRSTGEKESAAAQRGLKHPLVKGADGGHHTSATICLPVYQPTSTHRRHRCCKLAPKYNTHRWTVDPVTALPASSSAALPAETALLQSVNCPSG